MFHLQILVLFNHLASQPERRLLTASLEPSGHPPFGRISAMPPSRFTAPPGLDTEARQRNEPPALLGQSSKARLQHAMNLLCQALMDSEHIHFSFNLEVFIWDTNSAVCVHVDMYVGLCGTAVLSIEVQNASY